MKLTAVVNNQSALYLLRISLTQSPAEVCYAITLACMFAICYGYLWDAMVWAEINILNGKEQGML